MSTEFQNKAHDKLNPGGAVAKLLTVKSVEDLLALHNDEQTTAEINRAWKELRAIEEHMIGGKLSLTIEYKADGDTGKKELTITHALSLPKPPSKRA